MDRQPIRVTAAVIVRDGKVLIARRSSTTSRGDRWEFPGGKVERGESDREALVRELDEELGIAISVGRLTDVVDWDYPDIAINLRAYECSIVRGEPVAHEHRELRWVTPRELGRFRLSEADVPIANRIAE